MLTKLKQKEQKVSLQQALIYAALFFRLRSYSGQVNVGESKSFIPI